MTLRFGFRPLSIRVIEIIVKNRFLQKRFFATVQKRCLVAKNVFCENLIIFLPNYLVIHKKFCQTIFSKVIAIYLILKVRGQGVGGGGAPDRRFRDFSKKCIIYMSKIVWFFDLSIFYGKNSPFQTDIASIMSWKKFQTDMVQYWVKLTKTHLIRIKLDESSKTKNKKLR